MSNKIILEYYEKTSQACMIWWTSSLDHFFFVPGVLVYAVAVS